MVSMLGKWQKTNKLKTTSIDNENITLKKGGIKCCPHMCVRVSPAYKLHTSEWPLK